jgi:hypothetical protein
MRWSDYITGEYWILPSGGSEYADQDVGEAGHEKVALENLVDQDVLFNGLIKHYNRLSRQHIPGTPEYEALAELLDKIHRYIQDDEQFALLWDLLQQQKEGRGVVPSEIGAASVDDNQEVWDLLVQDPRWAFARTGAILVINNNFAAWKINDESIKRIQDFILDQAFEAGDLDPEDVSLLDGDATIEEYATGEFVTLPINDFLTHKHRRDFWGTYSPNSKSPGDVIRVGDTVRAYGDGSNTASLIGNVVSIGRVNVKLHCSIRFSPTGPWYEQTHTVPRAAIKEILGRL